MGIQFKDVSYAYRGYKVNYDAIGHITLDIKPKGEFIAVVGHTGSGKSTLVQHMNALLLPTKGNVVIFGQDLPPKRHEKINYLRQKVGLVFQFPEYQLFEETILKDIMFGPKNFKSTESEAEVKAKKAAAIVGIDESLFNQSPFRISGGQMRRVAVAGILAMEPDILVLDNGRLVFDGTKEMLFEHPQFDDFHLDLPTPLKILKTLEKEVGLVYKPHYDYASLLAYLKGVQHE